MPNYRIENKRHARPRPEITITGNYGLRAPDYLYGETLELIERRIMDEELRTGYEWMLHLGDKIMDADGWNVRQEGSLFPSRDSFFTMEITKSDYESRLAVSTILNRRSTE